MRARALFAVNVGALLLALLAIATPAAGKAMIAEAHISGPELGESGLRIRAPATEGMWASGIDVAGGLDDTRPDSVVELGITADELGPRYIVTYRLDAGTKTAEIIRQELYPYAKRSPVTHTPPGKRIAEGLPWGGAISAGWYQSPPEFFRYLVNQGLPETNPVAAADRESGPDTVPAAGPMLGRWIVLALAGLVALSLVALSVAAPRLRRRVLAVAKAYL